MNRIDRRRGGTTAYFMLSLTVLILLSIAMFSFELSRLHLGQNQLRAATDAAALAAGNVIAAAPADGYTDTGDLTAKTMKDAQKVGLSYMQKNMVLKYNLNSAQLGSNVSTTRPPEGQALVEFTYNKSKQTVTAHCSIGATPAFGNFLGLDSMPMYAESSALCGSTFKGDIVFVVDISNSMRLMTESMAVKRQYNDALGRYTYTGGQLDHSPSTFPNKSITHIPDVSKMDFNAANDDGSPVHPRFKNIPDNSELKMAALVEAKAGNLENPEIFQSSKVDKLLGPYVTPEAGYQDDYQRMAVRSIHPLFDEKVAVVDFINKVVSKDDDVHFGLVTFAPKGSVVSNVNPTFSTRSGFQEPFVALDKDHDKAQEVIQALMPCTTFNGTNTAQGIRYGNDMLTGAGHRDNVPQTLMLLTDGVPTVPLSSCIKAASETGAKGITLVVIGFFHSPQSIANGGPRVVQALAAAAGSPPSKYYVAPDIPTLKDILKQLAAGDVRLVNRQE